MAVCRFVWLLLDKLRLSLAKLAEADSARFWLKLELELNIDSRIEASRVELSRLELAIICISTPFVSSLALNLELN